MASINWQGLTSFVTNGIAAVQAAATAIIDASVGSVTLAWQQSVSGVALWLQAEVVQVLALTRFATSFNSDADSWGADFEYDRLPGTYATSVETFGRFTDTQQAVIPAGTLVGGVPTGGTLISTGPGGTQFMVMEDTTNAAYNATLGAYVILAGTASISATIQCTTAGAAGNVLANTIQSFVQGIDFVDFCTNPDPITNGLPAETDVAYKARFPNWLAGKATACDPAIQAAIQGVQINLQYLIVENFDYPGTTQDFGSFFVIIDDGSGSPPTSLLDLVNTAIQAVRGFTIRYQGAFAPTLVAPSIALSVRVVSGFVSATVEAAVQAAIVTAVNAVPLDALILFADQIAEAATAVPGVAGVQLSSVMINGVNGDFTLTTVQRLRISTGNVTVGTY